MNYINSLRSEWLKTRNGAALWLCISGGFFMPFIFLIGSLLKHRTINDYGKGGDAWLTFSMQQWELMAVLLLPVGIVLAATLMTQIEYRNNTWKQLHTTPQHFMTIFLAKLTAIVLMTVLFFVIFQTGILVSGAIPALIFSGHLPQEQLPWHAFWNIDRHMFMGCLPVIALQLLLSLQLRNFMLPVGLGFLMVVGSILLVKTTAYAWLSPYSFTILYLSGDTHALSAGTLDLIALTYFMVLSSAAYCLYVRKKEKG